MVEKACNFIKERYNIEDFKFAVLLGSGLSASDSDIKTVKQFSYSEIPGMPQPLVPGHEGKLKIVSLGKLYGLIFEGRFHYYEGREDWEVRFIPEIAAHLGCKIFVSTSAVGAVSRKAALSDVVVVNDHINLIGRNPLVGLIKEYRGKVFVDLKDIYDSDFNRQFLKESIKRDLKATEGVLTSMLGPTYETFAEIKMLSCLGADIVSMSTVPEIIAAKFFGMRVAALGVVSNDTLIPDVSHEEVLAKVEEVKGKFIEVLFNTLINLFNPLSFKYS